MCLKNDPPEISGTLGGLLGRAALADTATTPAPADPAATPPKKGLARAKLWTLDKKYHCLIIGTCLSVGELSKIARRFRFNARGGDDYGKHVEAVGCCATRNEVSETLQKALDKRYAGALASFAADRDEAAVLSRWNDCLARGEVAGPLWAAISHKHAGPEVRHAAYAAVHMLSHQVGAGLAADVRRLDFLEQDNSRLRLELAATRATLAQRAELSDEEHRDLKQQIAALRTANATLARAAERLDRLENGVTLIELGRKLLSLSGENRALQSAAARADGLAERVERLQAEGDAARAECARLHQERAVLERLLLDAADAASAAAETTDAGRADCPNAGDCLRCAEKTPLSRGRCILCVGGRTSLLSHYRALAERLGIRLIHHDGGQEEALSRLPELIAGADAVLCPTDCVSHAAYYSLKQHCRKSGKPCLLFKGAGVTSFAFALSRLSAGESSLPTIHLPDDDQSARDSVRSQKIQANAT
ncbi:MAG TPA: DUF2325 domain-containing protein [Rhodocyclaceae bacterium]|nr:DUF2325 domain-containing protein [Rhodocyclaceae bacterium]